MVAILYIKIRKASRTRWIVQGTFEVKASVAGVKNRTRKYNLELVK